MKLFFVKAMIKIFVLKSKYNHIEALKFIFVKKQTQKNKPTKFVA
jgi:hypothetical protein